MADAPLTVTVTHMRESSGNEWWSAHLYRATGKPLAFTEGYEFYQSPIKGRVDYEADCMRKLLDPSLPDVDILAYDTDAPATPSPPVAAPPATPDLEWTPLPVDPREQADFDRGYACCKTNDPREKIAFTLGVWARGKAGGSYEQVCRIMANEVMKMHLSSAAQPQPQPAQPLTPQFDAMTLAQEELVAKYASLLKTDPVMLLDIAEALYHAEMGGAPADGTIRRAIRDYHYALDTRQHGDVAQRKAFGVICKVLGMHWVQGQERTIRDGYAE